MTDVKRLDSGPLQLGSRARLRQPGLPPLTWELTELQQGTQFTWVCRLPGVTAIARHEIIASETGSRLELTTLTWTGPFAGLVAALEQDPHSPTAGNRGQRRQGPQRASLTGRMADAYDGVSPCGGVRERPSQLAARGDAQLGEDVAQVPFDRAGG